MTTRSTILLALILAFAGIFLSSCDKERIENIDIPKPFEPKLGVDSIYWDTHTQPTPSTAGTNNKANNVLAITTPNSVQIVVENISTSPVYKINLWARIQGIDEDIRIAYLDKIPQGATQLFAPTFIHRSVYLPCASGNVVQLFLPAISQNSNITITYVLSNE